MNLHCPKKTPRAAMLRAAAVAALALLAATTQAQTLALAGTGTVYPQGEVVDNVEPLLAISVEATSLGGVDGWSLIAPFDFDYATATGGGSFSLARGDDGLYGSLSTAAGGPGSFELSYTITGGIGQYAGVTGSGSTVVTLLGFNGVDGYDYEEIGQLTLVPEPASGALLLGGLTWLAARRRRPPH